jgi:hypothetical protein
MGEALAQVTAACEWDLVRSLAGILRRFARPLLIGSPTRMGRHVKKKARETAANVPTFLIAWSPGAGTVRDRFSVGGSNRWLM